MMRLNNLTINENATLKEALEKIDLNGLGIIFITNQEKILIGVLTDGDLRRLFLKGMELSRKLQGLFNTKFVFKTSNTSTEELLNSFNEAVKIIPIINDDGKIIDYASPGHPRNTPIAEPNLMGNELAYVHDCIKSGWVSSQGKYVVKFENLLTSYLNRPSLTVSNGTVAIHLALLTLGIKQGDEVIVPDLTFAATINAVLHCGAKPVISDVNRESWNMDIESIKKVFSKKTKAIIAVHLYGNPCKMDEIGEFCSKNGLFLIEDCAESIGSYYNSKPTGTFGDAATFSFFGNKTITTGEGGMVSFKLEANLEKAKIIRDHGMSKTKRYWHDLVGYNYRMTNIQAALGVAQFERIDSFVYRKREIAHRYLTEIISEYLKPQKLINNSQSSYWLYSIELDSANLRDDLMNHLKNSGIETRKVFFPLSSMPLYSKYTNVACTNSQQISDKSLSLPTYPSMTPEQVDNIIEKTNLFFNEL